MLHLFKSKRYRPLGILVLFLFAYLIVFVVGVISIFKGHGDTMDPIMDGLGILVNLYCIVFCITQWKIGHQESIHREQEWKKRYNELNIEYEPIVDYQKSRRQVGWTWTGAIVINLFSLSTIFW